MSNIIETTVPIPVSTLRDIIGKEDVKLIVDLSGSKVNPQQALIYLSNLELNIDVIFSEEDKLNVLSAYLTLPTLLKCPKLETMALELILQVKEVILIDWLNDEWIEEHSEIITKWISLIDSMTLYMLTTVNDDGLREEVNKYPLDESSDTKGINFVHLFDNILFPVALSTVNKDLLKNYSKYFNDYMYKGKSLFHFWAVPENDFHLTMVMLASEELVSDEDFSTLIDDIKKSNNEAD